MEKKKHSENKSHDKHKSHHHHHHHHHHKSRSKRGLSTKKKVYIILAALAFVTLALVMCEVLTRDPGPIDIPYETDDVAVNTPDVNVDKSLASLFTKQSYSGAAGELSYWLHTPENATEKMPLIVVLHSSLVKSEDTLSATDNLDVMIDPAKKDITSYIYNGKFGEIPAYIIMPQTSSASCGWAKRGAELTALIEDCCVKYNIDRQRVNLVGYSMGGTGALELAAAYPQVFNRAMIIAGGLDGVTNNIIPYVKGEGRMKLGGDFFPELRIPDQNEPSSYEPEMMKFAYAAETDPAFTVSTEEKSAAGRFKDKRISDVSASLSSGDVSTWFIIGSNDSEVSPAVSTELSQRLDSDLSRCDIINGCGHSGILSICLEKNQEIIDFLLH